MSKILFLLILFLGVFSSNSFGIIGGEKANGEFPQILKLRIYKDSVLVSLCTGSIVGKKTILTAAHCLMNSRLDVFETDARRVEVDYGDGKETIFAYTIPSGFQKNKRELDAALLDRARLSSGALRNLLLKNAKSDLALLYLRDPVHSGRGSLSLGSASSSVGDSVEIAGFGEVQQGGRNFFPSELYLGRNQITSRSEGVLILTNTGGGAITSVGDSGGPLLDQEQNIIGILSGGGPYAGSRESFFTEVSGWKSWIQARIR